MSWKNRAKQVSWVRIFFCRIVNKLEWHFPFYFYLLLTDTWCFESMVNAEAHPPWVWRSPGHQLLAQGSKLWMNFPHYNIFYLRALKISIYCTTDGWQKIKREAMATHLLYHGITEDRNRRVGLIHIRRNVYRKNMMMTYTCSHVTMYIR